jgi:hypothetical protein
VLFRYFPATALLAKNVWRVRKWFLAIAIAAAIPVLVLHGYNQLQVRKAKQLLRGVAEAKSQADMDALERRFPGLSVSFFVPIRTHWWGKTLGAIGTYPWAIYAKWNGHSWPKYVLIGQAKRYDRLVSIGESTANDPYFADVECTNPSWRRHPGFLVEQIRTFDGLRVRVSETASPDWKAKAWSVDLDCLGSWRGCDSGLDLHPVAARIYEEDKRAFNGDWPQIVLSNPACKQFWHLYKDK